MILILLLPLIIGAPFTCLLFKGRQTIEHLIFWSSVFAAFLVGVVGSLSLGIGQSAHLMVILVAALWAIAVVAVVKRCELKECLPYINRKQTVLILGCILCIFFISNPSLNRDTMIGTPIRIGPDIIGNAVASNALAKNITLNEVELEILKALDAPSLQVAFEYKNHLVYETLNLRTQIRTEFLLAGMRWGLPLFAAIPLRVVGTKHVYEVLPLLQLYSLFVSMLGAILICRSLKRTYLETFSFAVLVVSAPILLNSMYEGGASQIWAYQMVLALIVVELNNYSWKKKTVLLTIVLSATLIIYADLWVMLGLIVTFWVILEAIRLKHISILQLPEICALLLSLVVSNHYGLRFIPWFIRRLSDAGGGGWSMPHWMTPSEILGVVNAFNQQSVTGVIPRSPILTTLNQISNPILIGLFFGCYLVVRERRMLTLHFAAVIVLYSVYVKTRFIDEVSNYQIFKTAACLLPILWIPLILTPVSRERTVRRTHELLLALISTAVVFSSVNYLNEYKSHREILSAKIGATLSHVSNQKLFTTINVVAPLGAQIVAMSAYVDLNWFGRGAFGKIEGRVGDSSRPLYLLIENKSCEDWMCLTSVPAENLLQLSREITLLKISENSRQLVDIEQGSNAGKELFDKVSILVNQIGGPILDSSFVPVSTSNS
jgi:hypothetical protein